MSVSTPQLVGRDAELEVVDDTLEAVGAGASRALGLLGEPCIGKSWLLGELARRAAVRGHLVLAGRAAELEPVPRLHACAINAANRWRA